MKKTILIVSSICVVICCIYSFCVFRVQKFSLKDIEGYSEHYEKSLIDENPLILGTIESRQDVVKKAESVLFDVYGEQTIKKEKPYKVSYDKFNDVWLVQGRLRFQLFIKGGVAKIFIHGSDGKVITFWHEE